MPLQSDGRLLSRTMPTPVDHNISHFDPWRGSNLGTTSATLVIPCPKTAVGERKAQLAVSTIYATASGTGAKLQIRSNTDVIMEFKLMDGYPLELSFSPANITVEPWEDLTLAVTGATSNASVSATGVVYK